MLLLPGNAKALMDTIKPDPLTYGWLLTPRRTMTITGMYNLSYAVDNECYTLGPVFDGDRFIRALRRIKKKHGTRTCLFTVAPDIVGDPITTLERFQKWEPIIHDLGFPVALAAQDGLEYLEIPWSRFEAIFIGGTTQWKLGPAVAEIMRQAKEKGKWTHMARVNSVHRAVRLREPPDSVDGTAWAKHPTYYALQWQRWVEAGKPSFVGTLL